MWLPKLSNSDSWHECHFLFCAITHSCIQQHIQLVPPFPPLLIYIYLAMWFFIYDVIVWPSLLCSHFGSMVEPSHWTSCVSSLSCLPPVDLRLLNPQKECCKKLGSSMICHLMRTGHILKHSAAVVSAIFSTTFPCYVRWLICAELYHIVVTSCCCQIQLNSMSRIVGRSWVDHPVNASAVNLHNSVPWILHC